MLHILSARQLRRTAEIAQPEDAAHHRRKSAGYLRVAIVCHVQDAIDEIAMHLYPKGVLHLRGVAGKCDAGASFRDLDSLQPVALQPGGDRRNVRIVGSVGAAEFIRMQPMMIIGGTGIVLPFHERCQPAFLFRAAVEHDSQGTERQVGLDEPPIEFRACHGMRIARQEHGIVRCHTPFHPGWHGLATREGATHAEAADRAGGDGNTNDPSNDLHGAHDSSLLATDDELTTHIQHRGPMLGLASIARRSYQGFEEIFVVEAMAAALLSPSTHAVAAMASMPEEPVARSSTRSPSGLPTN